MTNYYLCPWAAVFQYFTDTGIVLSGGLVNTYLAGTSTPQATYTDITGTVPNANPIMLLSNGRLPASIWQPGGVALKIIVTDANGNQLGPTFDQVQGINDLVLADSALANPASGSGADLVANAMRSYDIFASARAANVPILQSGQTLIVDFEGGITVADGLGGLFYWNAASTAADDGLNVIQPTGLTSAGRYLRLSPYLSGYGVKGATTSRASTVAVAIDPDLQVPLPNGGTYIIDGWLNDASGTSSGGLQGQINFSGTLANGYWGSDGVGTAVTPVALTAIGTTAELQSAQTGVGNMPLRGSLQCSTAGLLSFYWAQNTSNATASVLGPGSYIKVTRVSSTSGSFTPTTHSYNTPGSATETIPVGATTLTVEGWGGSGAGGGGSGTGCGAHGGGGGGSGGYFRTVVNVSGANGQTIAYTVGVAGISGSTAASASSISTGTFTLATATGAGGNQGVVGGLGTGGAGGGATGGNTTNTTGNTGGTGGSGNPGGTGGAGIVGVNGTGGAGGVGGNSAISLAGGGNPGLVVFKYV